LKAREKEAQQQSEPDKPPPQPQIVKEPNDSGTVFTFTTGWIGGGHNQAEACSQALATLMSKNPGKKFKVINSSEESRKDFLGHVTYNYSCRIAQG
jgi:hypothetical protein